MEKVSQQGTEKWVKKSVTYTECRPKGGLRKDNGNVVDPDYIKDKPERLKKDIPRNPAQCMWPASIPFVFSMSWTGEVCSRVLVCRAVF